MVCIILIIVFRGASLQRNKLLWDVAILKHLFLERKEEILIPLEKEREKFDSLTLQYLNS